MHHYSRLIPMLVLVAGSATAQAIDTSALKDTAIAAEAEILDVVANANNDNDDEQKAIIMRVRVKASPERIAELQESLNKWCEAVQEGIDCDADDAEEFGGLIAFYPIDQRLR